MDRQDDKIEAAIQPTTMTDALGNTSELVVKKVLSKREEKAMIKSIKAKLKAGEELEDDEQEYADENNIA